MHQHENYKDNQTPYKPDYSLLSEEDKFTPTYSQETFYSIYDNLHVESVDEFIDRMLQYNPFHKSDEELWLIGDTDLFLESGMYSMGVSQYIDCDDMKETVNKIMDLIVGDLEDE